MTIFGCCVSTLMFAHASNSFSSCLFRARYCLVLHGYLTAHGLFTGMTDKSRLMPHITGHGSAWAGASLGLAITAGNPRHGYRYGFITMRLSTETQLRQCSKLKHVGVLRRSSKCPGYRGKFNAKALRLGIAKPWYLGFFHNRERQRLQRDFKDNYLLNKTFPEV